MNDIVVRNPKTTLPLGSWYSEDEEKLICKKIYVVASILYELKHSRDKVRKLKNHPIHEFTNFLMNVSANRIIMVGELELLVKDIQDVANDFKASRNPWVKERTSTALRVMNEIIDGDYSIDDSLYVEPS